MENRQTYIFKNTLIRGTMGMLNDWRMDMDNRDLAYQYLMDITASTTEDDIIPLLRAKSPEELIKINKTIGSFLTPQFTYSNESSLTAEAYKEYGKFKGD
jgi:hypothetical protein